MAGGAGAGGLEGAGGGVGDVRFVVGGVDVFAVPAADCLLVQEGDGEGGLDSRREGNSRANPTRTHLIRKSDGIIARAGRTAKGTLLNVVLTSMADLLLHAAVRAEHGVAYQHAEALGWCVSVRSVLSLSYLR